MEGRRVAAIGHGLCLLVGIGQGDGAPEVAAAVDKIAGLRVFADDEGKMNRSIIDVGGEILVVSQFTLLGDVRRGRRPSFTAAADPSVAEPLIHSMVDLFRERGVPVSSGVFGEAMVVGMVNDGPVTLMLDVRDGSVR